MTRPGFITRYKKMKLLISIQLIYYNAHSSLGSELYLFPAETGIFSSIWIILVFTLSKIRFQLSIYSLIFHLFCIFSELSPNKDPQGSGGEKCHEQIY